MATRLARGGLRCLRCLLVLGIVAGTYVLAISFLWWGVRTPFSRLQAGPARLDDYLTLGAAVLAWACLSWLTAVAAAQLLMVASQRLHVRWAATLDAVTPALLRRLAAATLGTAIAVPLVGSPASATPAPSRVPTASSVRAPLPSLDRPAPPETSSPAGAQRAPSRHIVRHGDTLWQLAAAELPPDASDGDVARRWPLWHRANRTTIGRDPDLLLPGQVLVPPTGSLPD